MNMARLLDYIEKGHYPFKSYPKGPCDTVLFPGCSFPSQFPCTTDAVTELCRSLGMGVVFDCCGRPLATFEFPKAAARALSGLTGRLKARGVKRLVTMCPNCLDYLDGRLPGIEVVDIYSELDRRGFSSDAHLAPGKLFVPCPDKKTRYLETTIRDLYDLEEVETMDRVGCCGLKAQIAMAGPEAQAKVRDRVLDRAEGERIYTYCASCLGQFGRAGYDDCRHVLSMVLDVDETPDVDRALLNRAKRKFDRDLMPLGR